MKKTLSAKQDKKEILVMKYIFVFDIVVIFHISGLLMKNYLKWPKFAGEIFRIKVLSRNYELFTWSF